MKADIDDLRKRIDLLDESLVRLLNARAACALEIGRLKREMGIPIYQPDREKDVLHHVQSLNNGPLDDQVIKRLFERIIDEARHLERIAEEVQLHSHKQDASERVGESEGQSPSVKKDEV